MADAYAVFRHGEAWKAVPIKYAIALNNFAKKPGIEGDSSVEALANAVEKESEHAPNISKG